MFIYEGKVILMEFRWAVAADAELLGKMRIDMRRERETLPPPADEKAFLEANISYFRTALADGSYVGLIAFEKGEAVANGGICFHLHPPSYAVPNGKSACLLNMYTRPEARGRGLAGQILSKLVEHAREKGCCKVFLNASDMGKPLYLKFGFREIANEMVFDLR